MVAVAVRQIDVNGVGMHPVYRFLKLAFPGDITWNFSSKFLVDRQGRPIARYHTTHASTPTPTPTVAVERSASTTFSCFSLSGLLWAWLVRFENQGWDE